MSDFTPFAYITSHPQGIPGTAVEPEPQFVREVVAAMEQHADDPREMARWICERIDEYGVQMARPVFEIDGTGPDCSYCGALGAICQHPSRAGMGADFAGTAVEGDQ